MLMAMWLCMPHGRVIIVQAPRMFIQVDYQAYCHQRRIVIDRNYYSDATELMKSGSVLSMLVSN